MTAEPPLPLERLLAQTDWVTDLARALVVDLATADDVAQATWVDVLRAPPRQSVKLREWLAAIVRRKVQRVARTNTRRWRREQIVAVARQAEVSPSAAELAAKVATHRELVDAVLALDEPYRETVVLRFFENLDLKVISERTQAKHNTVRSRLQRGLQQLRQRLDGAPGGRERWLPGVLALSWRHSTRGSVAGVGGVAAGIALATTMKKLLFSVAALAAGFLFALPWLQSHPADTIPASPVDAAAAIGVTADSDAKQSLMNGMGPALQRTMATSAAKDTEPSKRRLVDREGKALAKVIMRAESSLAVRWQGGDRGWISGPARSLRILPADEERLRTDLAYSQEFFAGFEHPEEWRATVLGTSLPARETTTDDDGGFTFNVELGVVDRSLIVGDPSYVLVAAGETGKRPWIASATARVTGIVRDREGNGLPDTFVLPICPTAEGAIELANQLEVRTDDDGAFLVRKAAANGLLRVGHAGYETAFVPVGEQVAQHLDIVLRRRDEGAVRRLEGLVVDGSGMPIADASVWFGRQHSTTGSDGRFALPADGPQPQYALTIVAKSYALFQQDRFGARLDDAKAPLRDLLFVLTKKPLVACGLVIGSNGVPLPGALVGLLDPTLLDISFEGVEALVGGWNGGVTTAADGTFALTGLSDRSYRLRAIDPATGAVATSSPVRPETGDVVLRLPTDLRRNVRGTVLGAGEPLVGATVEIGFCTHITKGGGTQFDGAPAIACDSAGNFIVPVLPRASAWLCVRVGGLLRHAVPVEALPAAGDIALAVDGHRWLQLVGSASAAARTIHFESPAGGLVLTSAVLAENGDAPLLPIPAEAVAVVIDHGRLHSRRLVLTDDCAVLLRVP